MTGPRSDRSQEVARPESVEELADALRTAAGDGRVVRLRGAGTKWTWGGDGAEPDLVVDTTGLDGVVEHAAGDLVVTVGAGTPIEALQQELSGARQWLALDPPEAGATVGGVVATAASGPRRLLYGTPRDLLIGVTVVLADGTVARSGGKVVKNVAGYDLGKLFTGSFGTLGAVARCTFRLHPVAPARRVVTIAAPDPGPVVRDLLRSPLVPTAVEWDGASLHVVFETVEPAAEAQAAATVALAGAGTVGRALPPRFGARPWRGGESALKVTFRLSALGAVVAAVRDHFPAARLAAHAGSGVLWAGVDAPARDVADAVTSLRRLLERYDGAVVVIDAPAETKAAMDVWGPVRGLALMRRIKEQFDPEGRMSPGRFVGGI